MELAVVEMNDPQELREAVVRARNRERLGAGELGPRRVAVYKRDRAGGAAAEIEELLSDLETRTPLGGVGAAGIAGSQLPALGGQDLIRLAELELDEALLTGKSCRLALQHEMMPFSQHAT